MYRPSAAKNDAGPYALQQCGEPGTTETVTILEASGWNGMTMRIQIDHNPSRHDDRLMYPCMRGLPSAAALSAQA